MKKLSFVIPCYGSALTIERVVGGIKETIGKIENYDYEIILVNDNSPDHVWDVIKSIVKKEVLVKGVNLTKNFGQHAALMAGYNYCTGDIIISLDDDGQTPVDESLLLVQKIEEGYDVVYGSYSHKQHNKFRNLGTVLNNKMAEFLLEKPKQLSLTSYFAMTSIILKEIIRYDNTYPYVMGLVLRSTKKIASVPVNHRKRESGTSGYTMRKLINLWVNGFTSFSVKPLRISAFVGILFSILGGVYALLIIVKKIYDSTVVMGWSSIACLLLIIGGLILFALGIIGEYIGRIYICINKSPQYVVREVVQHEE